MSLQRIAGSFPHVQGVNWVAISQVPIGPGWSNGVTLTQQLPIQPTLTEEWKILGWSMTIAAGLMIENPGGPSYGRFGTMWGGLLIDTLLSPGPIAVLPPDLSTFAKLWDGSTDPPFPQVSSVGDPPAPSTWPVGLNYMLPAPFTVKPGQQFQMAFILGASLLSRAGILVFDVDYTLLYDDGQ